MASTIRLTPDGHYMLVTKKRDASIFREGDSDGSLYQVETGCVRIVKSCACGQRCILTFCFPGDLFGLGSHGPDEIDAEAVCDSVVAKISSSHLASLMHNAPARALSIIDAAHGGQDHHAEHFLVVSYGHADEKIAWFFNHLLNCMCQNSPLNNPMPFIIELPMSRSDIGDHLGMKLETVSREIAKLKDAGVIAAAGFRKFLVLKPRELAKRAALDAHQTYKNDAPRSLCNWMPAASK
jgi:CRP/FNR family transcriptional regulator, nitrogen fixation regulation protein